MFKSLLTGMKLSSKNWKMILLLLMTSILFSLPIVTPLFLLMQNSINKTVFAQRMLSDKADITWAVDLFNGHVTGVAAGQALSQTGILLLLLGIIYLFINTFFAGGILTTFSTSSFSLKSFFMGCGAYFTRFLRLLVTSLIFYGMAFIIYGLMVWRIGIMEEKSTLERPIVIRQYIALVILLLMLGMVNMVFDYAKIGTVVRESNKMLKETLYSLKWILRHFLPTFSLYFTLTIIGVACFVFPLFLRGVINQSSLSATIIATLVAQVGLTARIWTRLTFYAAQLNLYQQFQFTQLHTDATPPLEYGE